MGFGTYDSEDTQASRESITYALDHGYRYVDTAEVSDNEDVVGAGVRASSVDREDVVTRMVTRAAWTARSVRRKVPTNKPPDDRFTR
jgi:diketogulonate reductase-like aldo/keto reductase